MSKEIVALFSGCGGLDLGFCKAGFKIIWANDYDKDIWETYQKNHNTTLFDQRNIREINSKEIPDCVGIIGGPPCQSWSEGGKQLGINDDRGRLFFEYIRILNEKQPLFFLAENVSGMLHQKHQSAFSNIIAQFEEVGYCTSFTLLNAINYNVPQSRKRLFLVGYHVNLQRKFDFNHVVKTEPIPTLQNAIGDLKEFPLPGLDPNNKTNGNLCNIANHEYMKGGFSSMYMSRNRVRSWDEPSFTIQAGGRHAPIHPQANKMIYIGKDKFIFDPESILPYRRLSIRECARIQTFPDDFIFYYKNLTAGYKMIGNAVPVNLSYAIAKVIDQDLFPEQSHTITQKISDTNIPMGGIN